MNVFRLEQPWEIVSMVRNIIGLVAVLLICVACEGGDEGLVERGGATPTRNPLPE